MTCLAESLRHIHLLDMEAERILAENRERLCEPGAARRFTAAAEVLSYHAYKLGLLEVLAEEYADTVLLGWAVALTIDREVKERVEGPGGPWYRRRHLALAAGYVEKWARRHGYWEKLLGYLEEKLPEPCKTNTLKTVEAHGTLVPPGVLPSYLARILERS